MESPGQGRAMMITVADFQTALNALLALLCVFAHFTLHTAGDGGETEREGHEAPCSGHTAGELRHGDWSTGGLALESPPLSPLPPLRVSGFSSLL